MTSQRTHSLKPDEMKRSDRPMSASFLVYRLVSVLTVCHHVGWTMKMAFDRTVALAIDQRMRNPSSHAGFLDEKLVMAVLS